MYFFITAFGITLGKYNFRKEAVFTTIYHGRNDSRLSGTVGMLVKTLPVYCDFSGTTKRLSGRDSKAADQFDEQ